MPDDQLITIDAEYLQPGLAACYLRIRGGEAAFIETNTAHAAPLLLAALEEARLSPEQVRWVIVTHAHLDHAAGASALLRACPNATLVAHPRAARHLIDPTRLVASATAVYGAARFEELYGVLEAIPAARVRTMEDGESLELAGAPLHFLHTRGHANHHFVVHDPARDTVFTGDAFGLIYPRLQRGSRFAFASTSPTDFDAAEARRSVDRILALGTRTVCPTHFGEVDDPAATAAQLHWWIDRSEALVDAAVPLEDEPALAAIRDGLEEAFATAIAQAGLVLDESDRRLLALDVDLNAQGLAVAASKRRNAGS